MTTITVGTQPGLVAVNATTNRIYVANGGSNNLSVIDGSSNSVVSTITVGSSPRGIEINPLTNFIYVTNSGSNSLSVIDGSTTPREISLNPTTNRIYVALQGTGRVALLNSNSNTLVTTTAKLGTVNNLVGVAANSTNNRVYAGHFSENTVWVVQEDSSTTSLSSSASSINYGQSVTFTATVFEIWLNSYS